MFWLISEFLEDLIRFYEDTQSRLPLSPLIPEISTSWDTFYVLPKLQLYESATEFSTQTDGKESSIPIKFYADIFRNLSGSDARSIYISGEPGIGKTAFCTYLTMTWCELKRKSINPVIVSETAKEVSESNKGNSADLTEAKTSKLLPPFSDTEFLAEFDFLFLLSLRSARGEECGIEEMIKQQIIADLALASDFNSSFLDSLLRTDRTLVVLDGLDEWRHPDENQKCRRSPKHIPHRKVRRNCTIITTTRPWKMALVRLKHTSIDKHLEITGISSTEHLVDKVVNSLNEVLEKTKSSAEFFVVTKEKGLSSYMSIPIILMQLLCLWYEEKEMGTSKCEIYCNMLNMLFERSREKLSCSSFQQTNVQSDTLPKCFEDTCFVRQYSTILLASAELAFYALMSPQREKSLVFDESYVAKHISAEQTLALLETGLLSQHKSKSLTKVMSTFCFLHKTFQEFLCALHLAVIVDDTVEEEKIKHVFTVFGVNEEILELSEPFVFLCGLNPLTAKALTEAMMPILTNTFKDMSFSELLKISKIEKLFINGFNEASDNGYGKIPLALHHAFVTKQVFKRGSKLSPLHDILSMDINKSRMITLLISKVHIMPLIYELLEKSSSTLRHVGFTGNIIHHTNGYDLSNCRQLKYLFMSKDMLTKSIRFCTEELEVCNIGQINQSLEADILMALVDFAPKLKELKVQSCQNVNILLQVIATTNCNLTYIRLTDFCLDENLDLSNSERLKHLVLDRLTKVRDLSLNAPNLLECVINECDNTVDSHVLNALVTGSSRLEILSISPCTNPDMLGKCMKTLDRLECFTISDVDFERRTIIFPESVLSIKLINVMMSKDTALKMLRGIVHTQHTVNFELTCNTMEAKNLYIEIVKESCLFAETNDNEYISVGDETLETQKRFKVNFEPPRKMKLES